MHWLNKKVSYRTMHPGSDYFRLSIFVPSQHTKVGHYRPTSEPPFKLRLAGGPIVAGTWYADCVNVQFLTAFYLFFSRQ